MKKVFDMSCVKPFISCADFSDYRLSDIASANNAIIEFVKCSDSECKIGVRFGGLSHKTISFGIPSELKLESGYYQDAVIRVFSNGGISEVISVS